MDGSPPGSFVHGDSPGKNTGVGCLPPGDRPNPGIKPVSPVALQADPLPLSHWGSPGGLQWKLNKGLYNLYATMKLISALVLLIDLSPSLVQLIDLKAVLTFLIIHGGR